MKYFIKLFTILLFLVMPGVSSASSGGVGLIIMIPAFMLGLLFFGAILWLVLRLISKSKIKLLKILFISPFVYIIIGLAIYFIDIYFNISSNQDRYDSDTVIFLEIVFWPISIFRWFLGL